MGRFPQVDGQRGSLRWIQKAVNVHSEILDAEIRSICPNLSSVTWLSPLKEDDFAEYRDGEFLALLGLDDLRDSHSRFWPTRGPQWDALGRTEAGQFYLLRRRHMRRNLLSRIAGGRKVGENNRCLPFGDGNFSRCATKGALAVFILSVGQPHRPPSFPAAPWRRRPANPRKFCR